MKFSAFTLARIVWLLMLLGFGSIAVSAERTPPGLSRPAMVNTNLDSFAAAFAEPDPELVAEGSSAVTIRFIVRANGHVSHVTPYKGTPNAKRLQSIVTNTVPKIRFQPALCNGKPVDVEVTAIVAFMQLEKPVIRAGLTSSFDDMAFRPGAIAPQRVVDKSRPKYPKNALREKREAVIDYNVTVDSKGAVTDAKIVPAKTPNPADFDETVLTYMRKARFIPGWHGGTPSSGVFESRWTFKIRFRGAGF